MSQPYVSGPVYVFLVLPTGAITVGGSSAQGRPGANLQFNAQGQVTGGTVAVATPGTTIITRTAFFLGTTRGKPRHRHRHEYAPVMNDIGGGKIGTEFLYQGTHGYISHDLTKWNQNIYDAATSVPNPTGVHGANPAGDIGTAMILESAYTGVVWMYPYVLKPAMQGGPFAPGAAPSGPIPAGYYWPVCLLEEDGDERGTEENAVNLLYHAVRAYTSLGAFLTYTNALPAGVTLQAIN